MYIATAENILQQCDAFLTTTEALSIAKLAFIIRTPFALTLFALPSNQQLSI
tara:strand:+ start:869 stop:1024 length:156 start_codon:yes stop_codon:yes gene_type:complete